jgi:hypothetical protein
MESVIRDIFYLKSLFHSFGKPKPFKSVDTGLTHNICGTPVHIYYYNVKNKMIYTPAGIHTSYSSNYEGPHHPMCKIMLHKYKDYIFNEGGIKWKGETLIYSTESQENNDPKNYNDQMLLGVVIACFYSLLQRLHFYIHIIEDLDKNIDYGHNQAPKYTFQTINSLLKVMDSQFQECASYFMDNFKPFNLNQLMDLFKQIKNFSSDNLPERKQFILDNYRSLLEGNQFTGTPPPTKFNQTLKPKKKLF